MRFDITAFGEVLIDYTYAGKSDAGMDLFEQNPGGAPANVLACAARLGQKTAFIGKIGDDMQGVFLRKTLQDARINTDGLVTDDDFFTTLAFVSLKEDGERSFSFARKPGADTQITKEDIDLSIIRNSRIFHFGSLSLTDDPARGTTYFALEEAQKAGCIVSYDPNDRPLLWKSRALARERMRSVLSQVDMIKISDEEAALLTDHEDPRAAAEHLIAGGIKVAAVTLGKNGALIASREGYETVPGITVETVDTTGAGDAFWGAFLYSVGQLEKRPEDLSLDELRKIAVFANAAAALCVTKRGAIPAMPRLDEIQDILDKRRH